MDKKPGLTDRTDRKWLFVCIFIKKNMMIGIHFIQNVMLNSNLNRISKKIFEKNLKDKKQSDRVRPNANTNNNIVHK
jgi:hypothetical protein